MMIRCTYEIDVHDALGEAVLRGEQPAAGNVTKLAPTLGRLVEVRAPGRSQGVFAESPISEEPALLPVEPGGCPWCKKEAGRQHVFGCPALALLEDR